ncbi:MAG: type I glutamate--ammonia ligase [candidate division WOR-3 bacterium]
MDNERIHALIKAKGIKFLDLRYPDLPGRLRHVTVPIERLSSVLKDGVGFDSSSVAGFRTVEAGDMVLKPDLDTVVLDPFCQQPTLSCFAGIYDPGTGKRYVRDPRHILQQAVAALSRASGADQVMVRPEFEFYLFNKAEFWTDAASAVYRVETEELKHDDHTGLTLFKGPAYHVAPPFDRSSDFRSELALLTQGCGIPVKYHHHEGGRFSQVELEPGYLPVVQAADGIMLVKYLVRNLALRYGKTATFMPKPIYGEPGSGMHLHIYLAKKGRNTADDKQQPAGAVSLFGDERNKGKLSKLAMHFIGGILMHAPSLCALTNPSTNSYRRLVPGFEAPVAVFFSFANRTAAIRIPGYVTSARDMALEYRIPDASANPYLSLAAVLLAGLDGIRRKIDPGTPLQGRVEASSGDHAARALPRTLEAALEELRQDHEYLTVAFTLDTIDKWVEIKMAEAEALARRPHPWEYNLYYGC